MQGCDQMHAAKAHNQIEQLHEPRIGRNQLEAVGNIISASRDGQCARHHQGSRFVHRSNACVSVE